MLIPLIGKYAGRFAIVDDEQGWLLKYKWQGRMAQCGILYAVVSSSCGDKLNGIRMHRLIMGLQKGQREIDHINGNGLDNRRANLRICTRSENLANQRKTRGSSQFKGVFWVKTTQKWRVQISKDRKPFNLGYFDNEIMAAQEYDKMALLLYGNMARLNFARGGD